jgi:uncharacterized protein (TIGR03382 family)
MTTIPNFRKSFVACLALVTLAVGCASAGEQADEELRARESKIGGRWTPAKVEAPNGVGSYTGLKGEKCAGSLKPGTKALGDQLKAQFKFSSYGGYSCRANTANPGQLSIHAVGRALDVMTSGAAGERIANHVATHSKALGIEMIIWNRTIWRVTQNGATSKAYGGPNPHTDHVHIEVTPAVAARGPGEASVDPSVGSSEPEEETEEEETEEEEITSPRRPPPKEPADLPEEEEEEEEDLPPRDLDRSQSEPMGSCERLPAMQLCAEAFLLGGIQCGTVRDECGNVAECDAIPLFGCKANESCGSDNRCHSTGPAACTPRPASEVCAEAKSKGGARCGSVPDGCGHTLACDGEQGFGCESSEKCSANKCVSKATPSSAEVKPANDDDDEEDTKPTSKSSKDNDERAPKAGLAAGSDGCSTSGRTSGGGGIPALGLALAAGLVRRRRSRKTSS